MITIADPYVADMVSTVEMPGDPGSFEATCLADGCTWETRGYEPYVEDDCYTHVNETHRSKEPSVTMEIPNRDALTLQEEFSDRHPAVVEALRWIDGRHLPNDLQVVVDAIADLVREVLPLVDDGPQLTLALHDLISAKDALVRQRILRLEREKG